MKPTLQRTFLGKKTSQKPGKTENCKEEKVLTKHVGDNGDSASLGKQHMNISLVWDKNHTSKFVI